MTEHSCVRCGAVGTAPEGGMPPAWSVEAREGTTALLCDRCTRDHVRDIEGKLDAVWWA